MAFTKTLKFSNLKKFVENENSPRCALWVGTYGKYNEGYLDGQWLYLADYDTKEDFLDACRERHSDEPDPELMFNDCEYIPDGLYSEYSVSDELFDFAKYVDDNPRAYDSACAYVSLFGDWDSEKYEEAYYGEYDSYADLAQSLCDDLGRKEFFDGIKYIDNYIDFEQIGREWSWDNYGLDDIDGEDKEAYERYESMSDEEVGEEIWDELGAEGIGADSYFDWEKYGRELSYDFSEENGFYFWNS